MRLVLLILVFLFAGKIKKVCGHAYQNSPYATGGPIPGIKYVPVLVKKSGNEITPIAMGEARREIPPVSNPASIFDLEALGIPRRGGLPSLGSSGSTRTQPPVSNFEILGSAKIPSRFTGPSHFGNPCDKTELDRGSQFAHDGCIAECLAKQAEIGAAYRINPTSITLKNLHDRCGSITSGKCSYFRAVSFYPMCWCGTTGYGSQLSQSVPLFLCSAGLPAARTLTNAGSGIQRIGPAFGYRNGHGVQDPKSRTSWDFFSSLMGNLNERPSGLSRSPSNVEQYSTQNWPNRLVSPDGKRYGDPRSSYYKPSQDPPEDGSRKFDRRDTMSDKREELRRRGGLATPQGSNNTRRSPTQNRFNRSESFDKKRNREDDRLKRGADSRQDRYAKLGSEHSGQFDREPQIVEVPAEPDYEEEGTVLLADVYVSGKKMRAILDTGSVVTIFHKNVAGPIIPLTSNRNFGGANNKGIKTIGTTTVDVKITNGITIPVFGFVAVMPYNLLIGNDFFVKYAAKIKIAARKIELSIGQTIVIMPIKFREPPDLVAMVNSGSDNYIPLTIVAQLNGSNVNICIDTGASLSIASKSYINPQNIRQTTTDVYGPDDAKLNFLGETTVPVSIGPKTFSVPALVLFRDLKHKQLTHAILIGNSFNKDNIDFIDYKKKEITFILGNNPLTVKMFVSMDS